MDKNLAKNLVAYIEHTNSLLCKYASQSQQVQRYMQVELEKTAKFHEKLAEALDVMAERGYVPEEYKEAVFESMKNNPTKVAELLAKVNDVPKKTGSASSDYKKGYKDPIEMYCFG